jgi:carbonic anhydrase
MLRSLLILFLFALPLCAAHAGATAPHWSYEGADGPENWGELSEEFAACKVGLNQSPVDLVADLDINLPELQFQYHGTPIRETNNGHSIQLDVAPGNYLEAPELGLKAELVQAHFHSPSEHTVNGKHYAMEIHLVHSLEKGGLAVIGLMIEEGEENEMLNRVWSFMPENEGDSTQSPLTVFEAGVLPPTREYYIYNGSLTTPPCSEGVRWIVLNEPMTVSVAQILRFKEKVGQFTNRPIQDQNARLILH